MASTYVYNALKSFIATAMAPARILDFDEIDTALQQGTDGFFVLEESRGDEKQISFGDPQSMCHREEGVIQIHGFAPAPGSSGAARQAVDNVRDALRLQKPSGVHVRSVGAPEQESLNDGLWSVASAPILYRWDSHYASP